MGALGKMAGWAIEKGIKAAEDPMSEDIEKEIFRFNKSGDGKLTMEEWLEATRECNTGKALIHPNHAGKVWMFLYSPEECEGGEEKIAEIQNHPKRWAHLFDMMELEEPVYVPPPPFLVTFQWRKVGEEGKEEKTVDLSLKERTFGEMKKIGFELSGILLGRVLLRHGDGREECVIHCREASDYVDVVSGGCVEVVDKKLLKGTLIVSTRTTRSPGKKIEVEGVEYEKTVGWCKQKVCWIHIYFTFTLYTHTNTTNTHIHTHHTHTHTPHTPHTHTTHTHTHIHSYSHSLPLTKPLKIK